MLPTEPALAAPTETGALDVYQLKRLWSRGMAARRGRMSGDLAQQHLDHIVLDALGLGLEQTQQHLLQQAPAFEEFERWVVATTGGLDPEQVARLNAVVTGAHPPAATQQRLAAIDAMAPVLSPEDLAHWHEHGYVIVHNAVPEESRAAAERAI